MEIFLAPKTGKHGLGATVEVYGGDVIDVSCKAVRLLMLLLIWEFWRERNAWIFKHQHKSSTTIWCSVGAKWLRAIMTLACIPLAFYFLLWKAKILI